MYTEQTTGLKLRKPTEDDESFFIWKEQLTEPTDIFMTVPTQQELFVLEPEPESDLDDDVDSTDERERIKWEQELSHKRYVSESEDEAGNNDNNEDSDEERSNERNDEGIPYSVRPGLKIMNLN